MKTHAIDVNTSRTSEESAHSPSRPNGLIIIIVYSAGHAWFQLYFNNDEAAADKLLERCKTAGYKTIVWTVDVPEVL